MYGTTRRWLLLCCLGLLATAVAATLPRDLPLLTPAATGGFRLDAVLDQAEVNGPDLADLDQDWVVHEVLPGDFQVTPPTPVPGISNPLPPGFVPPPAPAAAPTVAQVQARDDAVRLSGTGSPTFHADLPDLDRSAIGLLVVKARAQGVRTFRLQLGASAAEFQAQGAGIRSGMLVAPGQPAGPAPDQVELADDGEWHTQTVSLDQGVSGPLRAALGGGGTARALGLSFTSDDPEAWLEVEFVHLMDPRLRFATAAAAPTVLQRDGVTNLGLHAWTLTDLTWRLVVPDGARFRTEVTAIDDRPFTLILSASGASGPQTLFERTFEDAADLERVEVPLDAVAGQDVRLTLEVMEESEPTVVLLLRPMVTPGTGSAPPNVLLYFCDTLRADGLSCYGNPRGTTPRLDELAAEGIQFQRCFAQGSWTYVSMPSVLTSLLPSANGVRSGGTRLPDSVTTVAEQFRAAGYLTAAFVTNDFVGATTHTEQGFDYFLPDQAVRRGDVAPPTDAPAGALGFLQPGQGVGGGFSSGSSRAIARSYERWLQENDDVPTFVLLHAVDPHEPYDPEEAYARRYLTKDEESAYRQDEQALMQTRMDRMGGVQTVGGAGSVVVRVGGAGLPAAPDTPDTPESTAAAPAQDEPAPRTVREELAGAGLEPDLHAQRMRALYDAEVAFFDEHFGRVLDLLDEHDLTSRTVVSFHADHGEEFLDHDRFGHGQSLYAELIRVPWILRLPDGTSEGTVVRDPVANLDVGPTLLGLCGLEAHPDMQGRNLAPALRGGQPITPAPILSEQWGGGGGPYGDRGSVAVIQGRFKTILPVQEVDGAVTLQTGEGGGTPGVRVFDLESDLVDGEDLAEQHGSNVERLVAWVSELLTRQREFRERHGARVDEVDAASLEMLRALGYVK